MPGNRYSYHGYSGRRRGTEPSDGLFGWTIFLFLLIGVVFLCWMGSYYIFSNPEKTANYHLLKRLHKIEPPQRFKITAAPRGEFLKPGQLLERFGSMTAGEILRTNATLLRSFIRNYHQNRDLVPYAVGTYRVVGTLPLSEETFSQPGLVALLQAVEQPEVLLEQLFTADAQNLPGLKRALTKGQEIKLEKPLDLSAVIHVTRLSDNRLLLTTMPLLYGSYGSGQNPASFSLEPPSELNLDAGVPVLTESEIAQLSGGNAVKAKDKNNPSHLRRIAEEMATPAPEPRVEKALPTTLSSNPDSRRTVDSGVNVARAIAVNAPSVLPAIPLNTPKNVPTPSEAPVPRAIPVGTPLPAISTPMQTPTPLSTPTPAPKLTPLPVATPSGTPTNTLAGPPSNVPTGTIPSEVWPIYEPGKMPRGRLVEASDADNLLAEGIGGERHYLKGRFAVTASGNGRSVLRPQGALAGIPMGPSSRVRVIVDFPAGTLPPGEGNILSRDSLRPFQIISIKRQDDGQINIYVREVTRGE